MPWILYITGIVFWVGVFVLHFVRKGKYDEYFSQWRVDCIP